MNRPELLEDGQLTSTPLKKNSRDNSSSYTPFRIDFLSTAITGNAYFYLEEEYSQAINNMNSQEPASLSEQRSLGVEEDVASNISEHSLVEMSISNSITTDDNVPVNDNLTSYPLVKQQQQQQYQVSAASLTLTSEAGELGNLHAADLNDESSKYTVESPASIADNSQALSLESADSLADFEEQVLVAGVIKAIPRDASSPDAMSDSEVSEDVVIAAGHIGGGLAESLVRSGDAQQQKHPAPSIDLAQPKEKKRIAPTLLSTTVPFVSEGNVVENPQSPILPVPVLSTDKARVCLRQILDCKTGNKDRLYSRIFRRRLKAPSEFNTDDTLRLTDNIEHVAGSSDTFWFARFAQNRFNHANARLVEQQMMAAKDQRGLVPLMKLWCDMDHVQRWHRRYMTAIDTALYPDQNDIDDVNDPVLPVYGDSDSGSGEYPDDLQREIYAEQTETMKRKAKAAEKEEQRVALIQQTVRQMCAKFEAEWNDCMLPKLQKTRFYLWRKHKRFSASLMEETEKLQLVRLPKAKQAIVDSGASKLAEIIRLCSSLRRTVYQINDNQWILKLVGEPCPPRPVSQRQPKKNTGNTAGNGRTKARVGTNIESGSEEEDGENSSYDSMDDFIDDTENALKPETASDSSASAKVADRSRAPLPTAMVEPLGSGGNVDAKTDSSGQAKSSSKSAATSLREIKKHRKSMFRQRGYARTRESRAKVLNQLRHFSWMRDEDDEYSDYSEDQEANNAHGSAKPGLPKTETAPAPIVLSSEEFLQHLRRHTVDEHFESMLFCVRRMACGLERVSNLVAGNLNPIGGPQPSSAVNLQFSMRLWVEFTQWTLVFGSETKMDAGIAADSIRVEYSSSVLRDRCISRIRESLERGELHAELASHQEQLPEMCRMRNKLAYMFVDSPVPLWTVDAAQQLQFASSSVRRAVVEDGISGLVVGRRWLPMLQFVLAADQKLHKAAFAEFYIWRQHCILDYERADELANGLLVSGTPGNKKTTNFVFSSSGSGSEESAVCVADGSYGFSGHESEGLPLMATVLPMSPPIAPAHKAMAVSCSTAKPAGRKAEHRSDRRRNIRAIRQEKKEILDIQQQQQESMLALKRRIELSQETEVSSQPRSTLASNPNKRGRIDGVTDVCVVSEPEEGEVIESTQEEVVSHGVVANASAAAAAAAAAVARADVENIGEPVLVNPGHAPDQNDVFVPGFIGGNLKEHQIEGIRFMWQNVVMLSDHNGKTDRDGDTLASQHGCVLAHSMGLGKTLQTIAFVFTLLNEIRRGNSDFANSTFKSRRVLIICPPTVQSNWAAEFEKWTGVAHSMAESSAKGSKGHVASGPQIPGALGMDRGGLRSAMDAVRRRSRAVITQVVNFDTMRNSSMRLTALNAWHDFGGVMIMGYRMFLNMMQAAMNETPSTAEGLGSEAQRLHRYLIDEGPGLVIADEGHCIKNSDTQLSRVCKMLSTRARVCLTGYPLQNRLEEYWTMVDFCFPSFLGDLADFRNHYVHPINNGLYKDSTPLDKRRSTMLMKALQQLLETVVHRRDSSLLFKQLPRKVEYFIMCRLTDMQLQLYSEYLTRVAGIDKASGNSNGGGKNVRLFSHGSVLLTICNHPAVLQASIDASKQQQKKQQQHARSIAVVDESSGLNIDGEIAEDDIGGNVDDSVVSGLAERDGGWVQNIFAQHLRQTNGSDGVSNGGQTLYQTGWSIKTQMAMHIIQTSKAGGERVLLFSRSIPTLDYLQRAIADLGIASVRDGSVVRIDGTTLMAKRQGMIDQFNRDDGKFRVFLISSGTGSIGINLVSASRVIIYDVGWNPLYDDQAVARAYRYGQKRRVYVYRLATAGTWEERVLQNNIFKVGLTRRVVDKQTMGRHVSKGDRQKYLQHPSSQAEKLSSKDAAELTKNYKDDEVFCSLLQAFGQQTCKVTPQATLLANEEEALDPEDAARFAAFLQQEKQRLGQIPMGKESKHSHWYRSSKCDEMVFIYTDLKALTNLKMFTNVAIGVTIAEPAPIEPTASIDMSTPVPPLASAPINMPAPVDPIAPTPSPAPVPAAEGVDNQAASRAPARIAINSNNLTSLSIVVVLAMLHQICRNVSRVQQQWAIANSNLYKLVSRWLEQIENYVDISTAGWKERSNQPITTIADQIEHVQLLFTLTPQLYYMNDDRLLDVFRNMELIAAQRGE
ncbi:hypothetical protein GGF40_001218 [Coemansia sp. RSA 1286]|nr:hypothetical protein GGF40_001218 [Coemansia sp. RSA 1286]